MSNIGLNFLKDQVSIVQGVFWKKKIKGYPNLISEYIFHVFDCVGKGVELTLKLNSPGITLILDWNNGFGLSGLFLTWESYFSIRKVVI